VFETDGDDDSDFLVDAEQLLASLVATRYPTLVEALASPQGASLRRDLIRLLSPFLHPRAQRRSLRVMCRLEGPGYDEPVLIKDVSVSGVRFLVQKDAPLDLTRFDNMNLQVRTASGSRALGVALVRRCDGDERHTDLACRFVSPAADHLQTVADLRSKIFSTSALPAEATAET
jgi:hypothetical protein